MFQHFFLPPVISDTFTGSLSPVSAVFANPHMIGGCTPAQVLELGTGTLRIRKSGAKSAMKEPESDEHEKLVEENGDEA